MWNLALPAYTLPARVNLIWYADLWVLLLCRANFD